MLMDRNLSTLDMLNLFGIFLQVMNYQSDLSQASNSDIMAELQIQEEKYFKEIIENQKKIIRMLEESISTQ
nr:MAG TPA: hypothetical protein [Caudoviricetes sp.]